MTLCTHTNSALVPGALVRITQQIPRMGGVWTNTVQGVVVHSGQGATGSWFAHSRHDKLWLDRVELCLDDGELVVINLDQYSHIEIVSDQED